VSGTTGGDFLAQMARSSAARVAAARARQNDAALQLRARATAAAPPLALSAAGFDVIAELKLRSPAQGVLGVAGDDLEARVTGYARAGAALVSVLTEPERFDGSLEHLARAAAALAPLGVPAMRKDFLVDAYQLYEARAAGAGGALLIIRMLPRPRLAELLDCAAELGLFVLLEAFDAADAAAAGELAALWRGRRDDCLVGLNCRDLVSLAVVPERLEALLPALPARQPRVAESGLATAADAARLARAGFRLALVGTALMGAAEPRALLRQMIASGRGDAATARAARA
jgi:indole-3-glycerol phosphate synthase